MADRWRPAKGDAALGDRLGPAGHRQVAGAVRRVRAADGPGVGLHRRGRRVLVRPGRRGKADRDRAVHRGAHAAAAAVRDRATPGVRGATWPPGTSLRLLIAATWVPRRAGPAYRGGNAAGLAN